MFAMHNWVHRLFPYAFVVEIVQLFCAFIAFGFTIWTLYTALRDSIALAKAKVNGPRGVIAHGNVRAELIKMVISVVFIIVGWSAILLPPPTEFWATEVYHTRDERVSITINRVGLMIASLLLAYDSFAERRARICYVREMRRGKRNETVPPVALAPPPGSEGYSDEGERGFEKPEGV